MRTACIAVAFLPLLLVACQGSTVRTQTRFLPPTTPEELACVSRCDAAERECSSERAQTPSAEPRPPLSDEQKLEDEQARREYDECSRRVQSEYEACEMGARTSGSRGSCYKPVCMVKGKLAVTAQAPEASHDAIPPEVCARIHEMCFKRCGGRVETQSICEGHC